VAVWGCLPFSEFLGFLGFSGLSGSLVLLGLPCQPGHFCLSGLSGFFGLSGPFSLPVPV